MPIVYLCSERCERNATVWLPGTVSLVLGVLTQGLGPLDVLDPYAGSWAGRTDPMLSIGLPVAIVALAFLCAVQVKRSFRPRYVALGACVVAAGFFAPACVVSAVGATNSERSVCDGATSYFTEVIATCAGIALAVSTAVLGVRRLLLGRAIPYRGGICLRCGYSLIGNLSGRCPECGATTAFDGHDVCYSVRVPKALLKSRPPEEGTGHGG